MDCGGVARRATSWGSTVTAADVRDRLTRALRLDLVGPGPDLRRRCPTLVVHQEAVVCKPLATRMIELPELHVRLVLHVGRDWKDTRHESELLREGVFREPHGTPLMFPYRPAGHCERSG